MTRADDDASTRNRPGRATALAVALLLASGAAAACDAGGENKAGGGNPRPRDASATPSGAGTSAATGSTTPPSTVSGGPLTLAELARRPCRAIDDEDTGSSKLGIFTDATETNYDAKSCQWGARGGLVSFTPYTSTDQTKAEKFKHLTQKNISGNRALLGGITDHGRETYVLLVSVGGNQSFRLMVVPLGEDAPGPDAPTLATNFAKAILTHLK
ncbi:DUF3558 family protein [Streptomyces sp. WMMC500]|uniref:DUF3558 family protein n=1 Tax=Streptomyces sp. WMMC500 TaxID=3015154 RepID=UPI00248CE2AC|nr:DUF3558 family protein [Streptomyces sp. WMMC500]WBB64331.1 DUF3558 family protein [Streptomyces sp. WMMC500]